MGWEGHKSLISLVLGFVVGGLGLIPILNNLGVVGISLPNLPETVLLILLVIGGAYLVINGFMEVAMVPSIGWISIFGGASVAIIGILKLLGKAAFAAFLVGTFLNVVFILIGVLLIIGAFMF